MNGRLWLMAWLGLWCLAAWGAPAVDEAGLIASLIDPVKLATLGERGANPRIQKCVYWLAHAKSRGLKPDAVLDDAIRRADYRKPQAVKLTKEALLRNLDIAGKLGCLDQVGLAEMRHGKAPTIRKGPYEGDQLSVDHIIPRAVCPELDKVIANLELMPQRMNSGKRDRIGARQVDLARQLSHAGLLSDAGRKMVERAERKAR